MIDENDLYTIDDEETKTIFFCVLLFYDFLFVLILLKRNILNEM